jgi:flagellar biosynthetic protein FliR
MGEAVLTTLITAYMLYLARVSALVFAVPVFSGGGGLRLPKIGLSAFVAFLLLRAQGIPAAALAGPTSLGLGFLGEIAIGLTFGWAVRLALSALAVGGHLVGQEMGLNMSSVVDPVTGRQMPAVATAFEMLGMALFFALGLHREMFRLLVGSYRLFPAGRVRPDADVWAHWASDGLNRFFEIGVRMVAPVLVVLLIVTLSFGLLMRAVPTLNIFDVGFVLRITIAFGLLAVLLPAVLPVIAELFDTLHEGIAGFVGA